MLIQIARIAAELLQQRKHHFLVDASLPASVRGMISVHLDQPWIPNFWTVAIHARRPGSERYFDFPIGFAEDGTSWFFPSRQWWIAHAMASHPPSGAGCDVEGHAKFLTSGGSAHAFDYASVFADGRLDIFARANFVEEYRWWSRAFPPVPEEAA